ncbi:MAG: Ig-like domain-containing protein [Bacteroides sp.]|nr:Ig-like domain-containing protein [Bacteroides sp.]MCM1379895.1 Ig-like domain-containing protein [Bacteroides sp.]MCM1446251.1 Ig-like domain-containing protein [Prevotella sp.]
MNKLYYLPITAVATLTLAACASLGHPDGGPRDVEPPRYVSSNPAPGSLNFKGNKVSIFFDENVEVDNPNEKVAISPAQKEMPIVFANGHRVDVTFRDSMIPNMTYTIDLADAVKDLNEGNVLDGFAVDFSTGDSIDTLQLSGMVLQARNLEPAQGMLLGVYKSDADSCITTRRFDRIARTNQLGEFTVRNLSPGEYQLFALTDNNRDYHWDRTEDVAFSSVLLSPTVETVKVTDTIARDSILRDSIATHLQTNYLPNNLLLTWFNEDYKALYLKDYKRPARNEITFELAAPTDSLPVLTIIALGYDSTMRIPLTDVSLLTHSATNDTLKFWLRDSTIIMQDTVLIEACYKRVDTLDNIVWGTDTLRFNYRSPKKVVKQLTLQEKIDSVLKISDTIKVDTFKLMQPEQFLQFKWGSSVQELNRPFYFSTASPIDSLPCGALIVEFNPDSVWQPLEPQPLIIPFDSISHSNFVLDMNWTPGGKYRIVADSVAVSDIYGVYNKPIKYEFTARNTDEYSTILFNITGVADSVTAMVELLNERDEPVRTLPLISGSVKFEYLLPATYYARLYIDSDRNGEWTNGDLKQRRQPEDVYYFDKKIAIKKNWDRSESWDINALTVDKQKPDDIKKNKPKPKAGEIPLYEDDEEDPDPIYDGSDFSNTTLPELRSL